MFSSLGRSRAYYRIEETLLKSTPTLFLTFDDGPTHLIEEILDLLEEKSSNASFFSVAERLSTAPIRIVERLVTSKNNFGNHSLDHSYHHLFTSRSKLEEWLRISEQIFLDITGEATIGFRPPAGIISPPLAEAIRNLEWPLILWQKRFYDRNFSLSEERIKSYLNKAKSGDIILLHDDQRPRFEKTFLKSLTFFLDEGQRLGFSFSALLPEYFEA